jgi:hypothetical protein
MAIPAAVSCWVLWNLSCACKSSTSVEDSCNISRLGVSPDSELHQPLPLVLVCLVSGAHLLHLHAEVGVLL